MEGIRVTLKNKPNLVYCVFTLISLIMSTLSPVYDRVQVFQVHTTSGPNIKKEETSPEELQ